MNILILEDNEDRMKVFRRKLEGHQGHRVFHAKTPRDAISMLRSNQIHVLFLDHDLGIVGNGAYEKSGPGTGFEVASWLADHPEHMPNQIILHSLNEPGRKAMKACLPADITVDLPGAWSQI